MKQTNLLKGILAIVVLLFSTHAWAYDFEVDNIQYTVISLDELTAEVSGLSDEDVTKVIIPGTVEYRSRELNVISIGESAFTNNTTLQSVSIPNTITTISSKAFQNCTSLSQVSLPESLTSLESSAFSGCVSLTSVTFGKALSSIGNSAFSGCTSLLQVSLPHVLQSIGDYAFSGCTSLASVAFGDALSSIGSYAFQNCTSLLQVSLPEGLRSIGSYAFYGSGLITITFPESITSIPSYCFYSCKSLTEVNLPSSLRSINADAFYGCSSLKELDMPNSVTSLGNYALRGCTELTSLQVSAGLDYLFDGWRQSSVSSKPTFEYYPVLWEGAPSTMKSIILKDGVSDFSARGYGYAVNSVNSSIGQPVFSNIDLEYYYVGRPLIDIKSWSYKASYNYKTYTFNYSMSVSQPYGTIQTLEIGGCCYDVPYFYQSVEYLILGENVDTYTISNIYQGNFKGIMCKSSIPPIVSGTFENSTYINVPLYVPTGSKATYEATEGWKDFWEIVELDDMPPGYSDAVQSIIAYGKVDVIGYYSIDGKKVSTPQRGINIIRYSDGTARKVLVK